MMEIMGTRILPPESSLYAMDADNAARILHNVKLSPEHIAFSTGFRTGSSLLVGSSSTGCMYPRVPEMGQISRTSSDNITRLSALSLIIINQNI